MSFGGQRRAQYFPPSIVTGPLSASAVFTPSVATTLSSFLESLAKTLVGTVTEVFLVES